MRSLLRFKLLSKDGVQRRATAVRRFSHVRLNNMLGAI
jgi:hypothetical protein